jgi:hypothetical protein
VTSTPGTLDGEQSAALREAITHAVLTTPADLRDRLEHDPAASLVLVDSARVAAEETSRLLREAVTSARSAGHSWDTIGRLIGVSRQAAQQRFGTAAPGRPVGPSDAPERKVLSPLTAFNEMAVLEREGRDGWHVVDYGPLFHVVESSDGVWQHRRAGWAPGVVRRMSADGWTLVRDVTFPWGYYKRQVG